MAQEQQRIVMVFFLLFRSLQQYFSYVGQMLHTFISIWTNVPSIFHIELLSILKCHSVHFILNPGPYANGLKTPCLIGNLKCSFVSIPLIA